MDKAIAIIQQLEGYESEPYPCEANYWTIGYGHLIRDEKGRALKGQADMAKAREMFPHPISKKEATELLIADMAEVGEYMSSVIGVPLNENQMNALVSFVFNIGIGRFRSSTLLKKLNKGLYNEIPDEMRRWNKADGKVCDGLVNRRELEAALWEKQDA